MCIRVYGFRPLGLRVWGYGIRFRVGVCIRVSGFRLLGLRAQALGLRYAVQGLWVQAFGA